MMRIIKYNALNKKNVKQYITILEENDTLAIIESTEHEPIISISGKSILGDIIDEAFKLMDKEYRLIYCQWVVCIYKLDQCEVWGLIPTKYTEEREKKYLYSDPIINVDFKFFYNKDKIKEEDTIDLNTLEDLRQYIIGILPGFFYVQKIKENFSFIKWYNNTESQLQALYNGNIQIAPIDEAVGWHLINKIYPNEVEKFGVLDIPYTTKKERPLYILVCKSYPNAEKILEEFNDALKILKETGVIQEIIEKYGAEQYVEVSK